MAWRRSDGLVPLIGQVCHLDSSVAQFGSREAVGKDGEEILQVEADESTQRLALLRRDHEAALEFLFGHVR